MAPGPPASCKEFDREWFDAGDGWAFAEQLARAGGALVSPGDFYGAGGAQNVRAAVVQPDDRIELVATRLGVH